MTRTTTSTPGAPPAMVPEHLLTVEGAQTIRSEIERLREQKEREMAARLRDARAYGDGGGNDDYLAIKEEEAVLAPASLRWSRSCAVPRSSRTASSIPAWSPSGPPS